MTPYKHLKEQFNTEVSADEEALIWSRVLAKRDAADAALTEVQAPTVRPDDANVNSSHTPTPTGFVWRRLAPWGVAVAVAASLVLAMRSRTQPQVSAGPLRAAPSQLLAEDAIGAERLDARDVRFDDGSHVRTSEGAHVSVLENSAHVLTLKQNAGTVHYAVTPGGPRRWSVDCALATIEVVGTEFSIEDSPTVLRVHVAHGVVLVRGELVPGRVQRLTSGEDLRVTAPELPSAPDTSAQPKRTELGQAVAPLAAPPSVAPPLPSEADLAWDALDALRSRGDAAATVTALAELRAKYPRDRRASLAAFMQARLLQDSLKRPREALACIDDALAERLPADIRPDAEQRQRELRCTLELPSCEASSDAKAHP